MNLNGCHEPVMEHQESGTPCPETADIETSSDDYATRFSGRLGEYFLELQGEAILDLLGDRREAKVLDVGGGHAQIAPLLVRNGFHVTVVGSSESCRRRLDRALEPGSFEYRTCNLLSTPFADHSFDIVLALRLLPHVNQWQRLIAEMCRVSRGSVLLDYPDVRSFNLFSKRFFQAKKAIERNTRPFACFHRRQIVAEFAKHGFSDPLYRKELFVPMAIHRMIGRVWVTKTLEWISRSVGATRLFGSPNILKVSVSSRLD